MGRKASGLHSHAKRGNEKKLYLHGFGLEWILVPTFYVGMPCGRFASIGKKMGRSRYKIIEENKPHFVTCTTVGWSPLFSSPKIVSILLDSLAYLQENKRISIYAYVIMENHLHLILSSGKLGKEIGIFKSFTARKIIDFLKERKADHILKMLRYHKRKDKTDREYQLWQEGSHPQAVTNEDMMFQKIEYIHNNPVKCGYVAKPEHWRYSSALSYTGMDGLLKIQRF